MKKIVCFGEVLWDNFKTGKKPGGAPMNVALHLFRNAIHSKVVSSIGKDLNGTEIINFLQSQGMSTDLVQIHPTLSTGIVEVHLDENQQATYTIVHPVSWDAIEYTPQLEQEVRQADALLFGSLASRSAISRQTLYKLLPAAKLKILDLNLRPPHFENTNLKKLISHCDILKLNEDELTYIGDLYQISEKDQEQCLSKLAALTSLQTICVTLGDKGAMLYHQQKLYKHSGFKVNVADTVGAGDAFLATFLSGFLKQLPMDENLARACAAGALVASRTGANPDYSMEDIDYIISA